jgi:hypothetical protein
MYRATSIISEDSVVSERNLNVQFDMKQLSFALHVVFYIKPW